MHELLVKSPAPAPKETETPRWSPSALETPQQHLSSFISRAYKAESLLIHRSMNYHQGEITDRITNSLVDAAERGVETWWIQDAISRHRYHEDAPVLIPFTNRDARHEQYLHNRDAIAAFVTAGGHFRETNPFNPLTHVLPVLGRSHEKMIVADDTVWVGGLNLADAYYTKVVDFMVRMEEPHIVEEVQKEALRIGEDRLTQDKVTPWHNGYRVLIDAGIRGQSAIVDNAAEMILDAPEGTPIYHVAQYYPDDKVLHALKDHAYKGQGAMIHVLTSHRQDGTHTGFPHSLNKQAYERHLPDFEDRITTTHTADGIKLHAKLLLVPGQGAIWGSHNFVKSGVSLGTKEVAVQTTDQPLLDQFSDWTETVIDASNRFVMPTFARAA